MKNVIRIFIVCMLIFVCFIQACSKEDKASSKYLAEQMGNAINNKDVKQMEDVIKDLNLTLPEHRKIAENALFSATKIGKEQIVQILLEKGVDINAKTDFDKFTPLHAAVSQDDERMIIFLISKGADVNAQYRPSVKQSLSGTYQDMGLTPLHIAVRSNLEKAVKILLENGAKVNSKNTYGLTPLHYVETPSMAEILLSYGAEDKNEALFKAVLDDKTETVKLLLKYGANANATDYQGKTPIFNVQSKEVAEILTTPQYLNDKEKPFMSLPAEINIKDRGNVTPLHLARNKYIAQFLIDKGADLNAQCDFTYKYDNDSEAGTPLHIAVDKNNLGVVEVLIKNGANINAINKYQKTPLDLVKSKEVTQFLLGHGAKRGKEIVIKSYKRSSYIWIPIIITLVFALICFAVYKQRKSELEEVKPLKREISPKTQHAFFDAILEEDEMKVYTLLKEFPELAKMPSSVNGNTALHICALNDYIRMAELVLSVDNTARFCKNDTGEYPYEIALVHRFNQLAEKLK